MEVNELEKHCREQLERLPKTSKMYEEHLLILSIIETNKKYFNELEKKDKIIDEMAIYIDLEEMDFNCSPLCVKEGCPEQCIKQYFENKVEGSK